jgi:hypothetical protein
MKEFREAGKLAIRYIHKKRNVYRILVGKSEKKRSLAR